MRRFRFGLQGPPTVSGPSWAELVHRAEGQGYDVVSMADHFDGRAAPLVALAYAAALTDRIHLTSAVLGVDFRNPVVLAQEVATLDELSQGRMELGIGAGWRRADYDALGVVFDAAPTRIDRLAAALVELRGALRPGLPIMVGGGGRRILTLAAQHADIVSFVPANRGGVSDPWTEEATVAGFAAKVDLVREAAGDRAEQLELHTRVWATPRDGVERLGRDDVHASPMVFLQPALAMADKLLGLRDELGLSYLTVSAPFADDFAPVIELLRDR
ncbi:MAG: LLM class F420-dependent oxidoreductase [Acidimicrobiia bacterium]